MGNNNNPLYDHAYLYSIGGSKYSDKYSCFYPKDAEEIRNIINFSRLIIQFPQKMRCNREKPADWI